MMSVLCSRNQSHILFSKGAPESIISRCSSILCNEDGSTTVLTSSIRTELEARFQRLELVGFYQLNTWMHLHDLPFPPSSYMFLFVCWKSPYSLYIHCVQRDLKGNITFQTWMNLHFSSYELVNYFILIRKSVVIVEKDISGRTKCLQRGMVSGHCGFTNHKRSMLPLECIEAYEVSIHHIVIYTAMQIIWMHVLDSFAENEMLRCLAIAFKLLPSNQQSLSFDDEKDLTFIGLVCFLF